jgi:RNA polymerase sigma-70 factor (ECF subfamily)
MIDPTRPTPDDDASPAGSPRDADRVLVALAVEGDAEAFGRLMQRHAPLVMGLLVGRLRDQTESEDLLQETFVSAWTHLPRLRQADRVGAWLMQIARNKLKDYYRFRSRNPTLRVIRLRDADGNPIDAGERTADPSPGQSERLRMAETRRLVLKSIGELREKYRVVLYLRLIEELECAEIARRLQLKESAVKMRIKRGLEQLRAKLLKHGIPNPD